MSLESLVNQITSVQFVREFAHESPAAAAYLDNPDVLVKLRDRVTDNVIREPVSTESFSSFCNSYVTDAIVEQPNWLQIIFRDSRFDLFEPILQKNPEACREVLPYIDSVPLSVFQKVWTAIGDENDLLTILLSKVLKTFEKEDRIIYALRLRPIHEKAAHVLCRVSIVHAPIVFAELAKSWPDHAQAAISHGILGEAELGELINFETSLLLVEGGKPGAKIFSRELLERRLQNAFSYEEVTIAWKFFLRQHDIVAEKVYLQSLLRFLCKDNRLWFVSNLMKHL